MSRETAWLRIVLIAAGPVAGVLAWVFTEGGTEALTILATVLSILMAMLIGLTTLTGDPESLFPGSWRIASGHAREVGRVLRRYTLLACLYMVTIIAVFVASLNFDQYIKWYAIKIAISIGAATLVWSLWLPIGIYRARKGLLDKAVESRKQGRSAQA